MTTVAVLKTDGNIRTASQTVYKKKPTKLGPPKIRLRLNDAVENQEKARHSDVKYSLNPSKEIIISLDLAKKDTKNQNYMSDEIVNRNKVSQMNKILFHDKTGSYEVERPGPRCLGDDSLSYLTRNGRSSILIGQTRDQSFQEPVYSVRCPSNEALSNLEKGRGSRMMNVLQHSPEHRELQPLARIRDEAATEIYKRNQVGSMANVLNHTREVQSAVAREPRCPTTEARETWDKSLGHSMSMIMSRGNDETVNEVNTKKRVKDEDGNEIDPQSSAGMNHVLKHSREPFVAVLVAPRVKYEGEEIAARNRGTLTSDTYNYNKGVSEDPAVPRIRPEAQEIADASRGNATKNLFMKYGKLPGDSKPKAHINRHSRKIALQSQGGAMRDTMCPPRQAHSKRRARSAHK